jgi:hypothetical protein
MDELCGWWKHDGTWTYISLSTEQGNLTGRSSNRDGRTTAFISSQPVVNVRVEVDAVLLARLTAAPTVAGTPPDAGGRPPFIFPGVTTVRVNLTGASAGSTFTERVPQCIYLVRWLIQHGCQPTDMLQKAVAGAEEVAAIARSGGALLGVAAGVAGGAAAAPAAITALTSGVSAASGALPVLAAFGGAAASVLLKVADLAQSVPFVGAAAKVLLLVRDAVVAVQARW